MTDALLFLYAETQVHAGGPESIGAIDLPIQRARHTGHPVIWGQSVKGALKDHARWRNLFGERLAEVMGGDPPTSQNNQKSQDGWLAVSDARLLAFPVPTLQHCFAWVASPSVLAGVSRYAARSGLADQPPGVPVVGDGFVAMAKVDDWDTDEVCVGSYLCRPADDEAHQLTAGWAAWVARNAIPHNPAFSFFKRKLGDHLLVVDDATFQALTEEFAELTPRIQLEVGTKTAKELFYEENLPSETIMVTLLSAMRDAHQAADVAMAFHAEVLTLGGSETVGRGVLWAHDPTQPLVTR